MLEKPDGWITFDVSNEPSEDGEGLCVQIYNPSCVCSEALKLGSKPIHAYILQVTIVSNHMNGKDTHVRGLRILGPVE